MFASLTPLSPPITLPLYLPRTQVYPRKSPSRQTKVSLCPLPPTPFPRISPRLTGALAKALNPGGVGRNSRGFDGSGKNGQAPKVVEFGGEGLDQRFVVREDGGLVVAEFRLVREVVA